MIETKVIKEEVSYNRSGELYFENDEVVFDTSDGEYGPFSFPIELLEEKLHEHKQKLNNG